MKYKLSSIPYVNRARRDTAIKPKNATDSNKKIQHQQLVFQAYTKKEKIANTLRLPFSTTAVRILLEATLPPISQSRSASPALSYPLQNHSYNSPNEIRNSTLNSKPKTTSKQQHSVSRSFSFSQSELPTKPKRTQFGTVHAVQTTTRKRNAAARSGRTSPDV